MALSINLPGLCLTGLGLPPGDTGIQNQDSPEKGLYCPRLEGRVRGS